MRSKARRLSGTQACGEGARRRRLGRGAPAGGDAEEAEEAAEGGEVVGGEEAEDEEEEEEGGGGEEARRLRPRGAGAVEEDAEDADAATSGLPALSSLLPASPSLEPDAAGTHLRACRRRLDATLKRRWQFAHSCAVGAVSRHSKNTRGERAHLFRLCARAGAASRNSMVSYLGRGTPPCGAPFSACSAGRTTCGT